MLRHLRTLKLKKSHMTDGLRALVNMVELEDDDLESADDDADTLELGGGGAGSVSTLVDEPETFAIEAAAASEAAGASASETLVVEDHDQIAIALWTEDAQPDLLEVHEAGTLLDEDVLADELDGEHYDEDEEEAGDEHASEPYDEHACERLGSMVDPDDSDVEILYHVCRCKKCKDVIGKLECRKDDGQASDDSSADARNAPCADPVKGKQRVKTDDDEKPKKKGKKNKKTTKGGKGRGKGKGKAKKSPKRSQAAARGDKDSERPQLKRLRQLSSDAVKDPEGHPSASSRDAPTDATTASASEGSRARAPEASNAASSGRGRGKGASGDAAIKKKPAAKRPSATDKCKDKMKPKDDLSNVPLVGPFHVVVRAPKPDRVGEAYLMANNRYIPPL